MPLPLLKDRTKQASETLTQSNFQPPQPPKPPVPAAMLPSPFPRPPGFRPFTKFALDCLAEGNRRLFYEALDLGREDRGMLDALNAICEEPGEDFAAIEVRPVVRTTLPSIVVE